MPGGDTKTGYETGCEMSVSGHTPSIDKAFQDFLFKV